MVSSTIAGYVGPEYHRLANLLGYRNHEIASWGLKYRCSNDKERAKSVMVNWLYKNMITSSDLSQQQVGEM